MAYKANVVQVMIASPGDVKEERELVREVISDWNSIHSKASNTALLPVGWDTHSSPELGARGQALINDRLLEECDLLIAIFRHRIGTPTAGYASGSVEEIQRHVEAGKPAMVYFSGEPPPSNADAAQLEALAKFRQWCYDNGLVGSFADGRDLKHRLDRELRIEMQDSDYLRGLTAAAQTWGCGVEGPAVTLEPPRVDLTGEARRLLIEASKDRNAMILQIGGSGGWGLQINGERITDGDARSKAKWRAAFEAIEAEGLIRSTGHQRQIFELTADGFEVADNLRAWEDRGNDNA